MEKQVVRIIFCKIVLMMLYLYITKLLILINDSIFYFFNYLHTL